MWAPMAGVNSLMYSSAQSKSVSIERLMDSASSGASACITAAWTLSVLTFSRIRSSMRLIPALRVRSLAIVVISDRSSLNSGLIRNSEAPKCATRGTRPLRRRYRRVSTNASRLTRSTTRVASISALARVAPSWAARQASSVASAWEPAAACESSRRISVDGSK